MGKISNHIFYLKQKPFKQRMNAEGTSVIYCLHVDIQLYVHTLDVSNVCLKLQNTAYF